MNQPLRVLLVEDSEDDSALLVRELRRGGYDPDLERVDTPEGMANSLAAKTWDIVVADYSMPRFSGLAALRMLKESGKDLPFIIVSGTVGEETAVEAMREGANDYLMKDRLARLAPAIERELREAEVRRQRKLAQEQVRRQMERIAALRVIDVAILGSLDLRLTLNIVIDQVLALLDVHAASCLLLNPHSHRLEYAAGRGFSSPAISRSAPRLGEGLAGRAALERRFVNISDLRENPGASPRSDQLASEGFIDYYAVPLIAKGDVIGVLEVYHREHFPTDLEWQGYLETLAGQAAIAIHNATLFENLQRSNSDLIMAYDSTLESWVQALDLRNQETVGHTARVTEMTVRLARAVNANESDLAHIRRGALLHDIGKIGVPDAILLKPEKLTADERIILQKHPTYAFEWLAPIDFLQSALSIPHCGRERWDGAGYPRGLEGEHIPLEARLFAVVDAWDALRSERPYRAAWTAEQAKEHIRASAGTQFDPTAVDAFLQLIASDGQ